jgi:hypothetical protein
VSGRDRDLADLRRYTLIWLGAVVWIVAGYLLQDAPRDPVDAAERAAFTYAMALVIPGISLVFLAGWIVTLRRRR